ncbi:hypothetical protein AHAS_Ahas14G0252000 [Arachis hypogaea]
MNCEKLSNPSMHKKKKLKHKVNKAKEQSSMEKKNQNDKSKSIHDILPLDLIHIILLRVRSDISLASGHQVDHEYFEQPDVAKG